VLIESMKVSTCVACALALLLPGEASAVLVYQRGTGDDAVVVAARNDGSHARVVAHGFGPQVSPRGRLIAYFTRRCAQDCVHVVDRHGGHHQLVSRWSWYGGGVAWSPDERYIVVESSRHFGAPARLINVRRNTSTDIKCGCDQEYGGATFTPDGRAFDIAMVIVSSSGSAGYLRHVDIDTGKGRWIGCCGEDPLWGRHGLAYNDDDQYELVLRKHLDEDPETILRRNAYPVDWSADGNRLLAWEASPLAHQAVLIKLSPRTIRRVKEPIFPTDLSHDGKKVLGEMDGDVVERSGNGTIRVVARGATSPSWTK
jgi:hypothetical protein